jgi:hypothetical protein
MPQNLVRYILLQFSPRFRDEGVKMLLIESQSGGPLHVHIHPKWRQSLDPSDHAYLSELIEEWENTPPQKTAMLFDELCRLSKGPLRVIEQQYTPIADRLTLQNSIDRDECDG